MVHAPRRRVTRFRVDGAGGELDIAWPLIQDRSCCSKGPVAGPWWTELIERQRYPEGEGRGSRDVDRLQ